MSIVVGIDEAGLGPNLGPFVVTAVVWEVDGPPAEFDFWSELESAITSDVTCDDGRLIIADSKALFQPHKGLARLEATVLPLLAAVSGDLPASARELSAWLDTSNTHAAEDPWMLRMDLPLPTELKRRELRTAAKRLTTLPARLVKIASRIVTASEFNRLLDGGNKAEVCTQCHLELLYRICAEFDCSDVLVYSDKHGGRNRYSAALSSLWGDDWIHIVKETPLESIYRAGRREWRFEPRAERHLPVAAASMISKYVRELHMTAFNRFWQHVVPDLRPTQGYPGDATRFYNDIATVRSSLGFTDAQLWRRR